jgi:hypothetical protein
MLPPSASSLCLLPLPPSASSTFLPLSARRAPIFFPNPNFTYHLNFFRIFGKFTSAPV